MLKTRLIGWAKPVAVYSVRGVMLIPQAQVLPYRARVIPPNVFTSRRPNSDNPANPSAIAGDERLENSTLTGAKAHPSTATMRSAIDVVKGREFWAFEDLQKNGKDSPYTSWYQAEFDAQGKLTGWSGWENKNGYLPEFRQVKGTGRDWDTTVEKGDLNAGAKEHIFAITKRWMDPNGDGDPSDGIDGWRLDVVPDVGMPFWHSWRAHVRANPWAVSSAARAELLHS